MLVTVSAELPLLVIVIVTVVVVPVTTLPKARFPLTPMTREGTGMPVAEQLIVLPPLVASLLTVTVPPYACTRAGANVTTTFVHRPDAIPPLQAPLNPEG